MAGCSKVLEEVCTEPTTEAKAYDGAVVTLVAEELTQPTPVRIELKEPIHGMRDWLIADAVLLPKGKGRQTFTVRLKGRPTVNMPAYKKQRYWKDGKYHDKLDDVPGARFGVKVTPASTA